MCKKTITFLICTVLPLLVGGLSGYISMDAISEFSSVAKPPLYPPAWLFPVVWTILYILMGISSFIVVTSDKNEQLIFNAIKLYVLQLFINFCWPIFFFIFKLYAFAFIWLLLLWITVFVTLLSFYKINKLSAYLLIPYILWLTFAGYLNFMIWVLN